MGNAVTEHELQPLQDVRGLKLRSVWVNSTSPVAVVWRPLLGAAAIAGSPLIRSLNDVRGELAITFFVCLIAGKDASTAHEATRSAYRSATADEKFVP
jgi:hypothetical protein